MKIWESGISHLQRHNPTGDRTGKSNELEQTAVAAKKIELGKLGLSKAHEKEEDLRGCGNLSKKHEVLHF